MKLNKFLCNKYISTEHEDMVHVKILESILLVIFFYFAQIATLTANIKIAYVQINSI